MNKDSKILGPSQIPSDKEIQEIVDKIFTIHGIEPIESKMEEENQSKEMLEENTKHYWEVINGCSKPKFNRGDFVFSSIDSCAMKVINRCYDEHWRYQIFDDVNEYWFFEKELKKVEIGDVVYSKVWKEKVIVRGFCDDKFILVADFNGKLLKSLPSLIKQIKEEIKPITYEEAVEIIETMQGIGDSWECPQGYQFKDENGNVINAMKIVLEKKHDDKLKLESTKKVREYWSEYARIFIEIYDDEPNACIFTHLWVVDEQRQKGHGKRALIEAETIAKELGCHTAYLKVETNSWMYHWYLRCGYQWYKNADKGYVWLTKSI